MSLRQSLQSTSISKNVSTRSINEKNSSLNTKKNDGDLTSIINTQRSEVYNDPVFKNEKGIPFTKEDRKRFLNEANKKNEITIAYLGKCLIFYCTLYSIYALLGISVMYFFMLGGWNSDIPNLTGRDSFIGIPGINMAPKLERKRENPTIKFNISDKNTYMIYVQSINQFFNQQYNTTQEEFSKEIKPEERLKRDHHKPRNVFKNIKRRQNSDNLKLEESNENISINNNNNPSIDNNKVTDENITDIEVETKVLEAEKINLNKKVENEEVTETTGLPINITTKSYIDNENILDTTTSSVKFENTITTQTIDGIPDKNQTIETNNRSTSTTQSINKTEDIFITNNTFSCSHENDYGYPDGEPCLIIYLNNVLNWKKPFFDNSNIPTKYQADIHNFINETTLSYIIPVSCQLKGKEQEGPNYFSYSSLGIIDQTNYYPFTNQKKLSNRPYMMIQLKNLPKNENLQISCRYYINSEMSSAEESAMILKFNVNITQ